MLLSFENAWVKAFKGLSFDKISESRTVEHLVNKGSSVAGAKVESVVSRVIAYLTFVGRVRVIPVKSEIAKKRSTSFLKGKIIVFY